MKNMLILGAGTAGTMMANHLNKKLNRKEWAITIIDGRQHHYYQPGFLFVPFGIYQPSDLLKPITQFIPDGIDFINQNIKKIESAANKIILENDAALSYDILIIATGTNIAPEETEGMMGTEWRKSVHEFYTYEGAVALAEKLKHFTGGNLVVHISELPIKCPVAPLEFAFLADAFFTEKGIRNNVNITYVTPLSGAFTKPKATKALEHLLQEKHIHIVPDFAIECVDNETKTIRDYGGKEVPFDLLVTVPVNKGDALMERSGLGDDLNYIPTHKETLQSLKHENIFVIGDATNIPASKAGSVAHFEAEILTENILHYINGEPLTAAFDGHANCFIETGHKKALLIDFNYTQEPVEGSFPFAGIGPLRLLKESKMNHIGKLAFKWIYWNILLKARQIPFVTAHMQTAGKKLA